MIRLIGSMMIGSVCAWLGFVMADRLKKRRDFLSAFITSLTVLETEIEFGRRALEKAFAELDKEELFGFYRLCRDEMREIGIKKAWERAAEKTAEKAYLNQGDIRAISSLGAELGMTDVGGQKKNIARAREILAGCFDEAESDHKRLAKVYKSCGVLAGIFIVIVFI